MNHNRAADAGDRSAPQRTTPSTRRRWLNDFYSRDGKGGPPLGNVQLLGKITATILKANLQLVPEARCSTAWPRHAVDWYLMSEDLPDPESRVMVDGERIVLHWRRTNMEALDRSGRQADARDASAPPAIPIVLSRPFDQRTPSHQCGTVRMGTDPATAPLDPFCRALRPPQPVRRRRRLPADLGGGQPGADHRRAGAARRRPHPQRRSLRHEPRPVAHRHRRPRAASASASPRPGRRRLRYRASPTSPRRMRRTRRSAQLAARGAQFAYRRCDIADLAGHAALVDRDRSGLRPASTAWSTMPASAPSVRGDLLDLQPENFDRVLDVNLRGTVFLTRPSPRRCWPQPATSSALDHQHHLGQRRDGLARARRLLHLQGRAVDVDEEPGAAAGAATASACSRSGPASSAPT